MKIVISENQFKRLFESNTNLDKINRLINIKDYIYNFTLDDSNIIPSSVILEGELSDGEITVRVVIDKVTYRGDDVTIFAKNYALYSGDYDQDTFLSYNYKTYVSEKINSKILIVTPFTISEYDVVLELY